MESGKCITFNLRAVTAAVASLVVVGGVGLGIDAYAATTVAPSVASATVVTPISISETAALNFGRFSAPTGGTLGTVTIAATVGGARGFSGGTVLVTSGGAGALGNSGVYIVSGQANLAYAVTNPSPTSLTGPGGAPMPVTFSTSPTGGAGLLNGSGQETLYVGGVLSVAAAQGSGAYTGNYNVTVEYN